MAQLFSKTTIQDQIQIYDGVDMSDAIQIVTDLYADQKNGLTKDETRYEQRFNGLFFGELLGYEENKNRHPKASTPVGGKIADLGLGIYSEGKYSYEGVRVIVELKGSTASLDKKQASYGGQTPVDQGFGYKTSFTQDPRLVVSNFGSIRLYRDNKQDYEVWTLEELASGDNDWYELKKLLLLMQKKNLIAASGESYTQKLLTKFRYDQEHISKKFYTEYKALRLELINDIRSRNEGVTIDLVVEKAQKLIDRVIFVHFCEDKGLLPHDKLKEVIEFGEKAMSPTFQTLTNFFEAVNSGSPKLEIPNGYNGGLFHKDPELDALQVGDEICRKFVALGLYDFDGELSVNILGHIFEQSISDLEQLKIDLLGTETQTDDLVETKTSKRKKDGIFYTPEYIVDYIIQHSLMTRLEEQEAACMAKIGKQKGYKDELEATMAYQAILQGVKVLDPACGSGAFLVKVFDYLYAENKRVGAIVGSLFDDDALYKNILSQNIYGVDLNAESVEITKLSLWLKSAQKGKKLNNLDKNIKCGNSLIDDPEAAGDKAFDWHIEFKDIMDEGGFDVVVGNPPYVTLYGKEKVNISDIEGLYYKKKYQSFEYKVNTFILFVELSVGLIKHASYLSFIIPDRIFVNLYFKKIREILYSSVQIKEIINLSGGIFDDATVDTIIFNFQKGGKHKVGDLINIGNASEEGFDFFETPISEDGTISLGQNSETLHIGDKIRFGSRELKELVKIYVGVVTGNNKKYLSKEKISNERLPVIKGANLSRYGISDHSNYVHRKPEELHSNLNEDIYFSAEKLLVRKTGDKLMCAIDRSKAITEQTVYNLTSLDGSKLDLRYIMLLINSSLLQYYFITNLLSNQGSFPQIKGVHLGQLPIKESLSKDQQPYIEKADHMLTLTAEYHAALQQTLDLLQSEYGLDKIPKKLQKFTELDFDTFAKTLKIKKLSLDQKEELMAYFNKKHKLLSDLQSQIDTLDSEIDEMVFDLYGLSEEERRIVLGG